MDPPVQFTAISDGILDIDYSIYEDISKNITSYPDLGDSTNFDSSLTIALVEFFDQCISIYCIYKGFTSLNPEYFDIELIAELKRLTNQDYRTTVTNVMNQNNIISKIRRIKNITLNTVELQIFEDFDTSFYFNNPISENTTIYRGENIITTTSSQGVSYPTITGNSISGVLIAEGFNVISALKYLTSDIKIHTIFLNPPNIFKSPSSYTNTSSKISLNYYIENYNYKFPTSLIRKNNTIEKFTDFNINNSKTYNIFLKYKNNESKIENYNSLYKLQYFKTIEPENLIYDCVNILKNKISIDTQNVVIPMGITLKSDLIECIKLYQIIVYNLGVSSITNLLNINNIPQIYKYPLLTFFITNDNSLFIVIYEENQTDIKNNPGPLIDITLPESNNVYQVPENILMTTQAIQDIQQFEIDSNLSISSFNKNLMVFSAGEGIHTIFKDIIPLFTNIEDNGMYFYITGLSNTTKNFNPSLRPNNIRIDNIIQDSFVNNRVGNDSKYDPIQATNVFQIDGKDFICSSDCFHNPMSYLKSLV